MKQIVKIVLKIASYAIAVILGGYGADTML